MREYILVLIEDSFKRLNKLAPAPSFYRNTMLFLNAAIESL